MTKTRTVESKHPWIAKGIRVVAKVIREELNLSPEQRVKVYGWFSQRGGYSVTEIAIIQKTDGGFGGSSWMYVDYDAFPITSAAREVIITVDEEVQVDSLTGEVSIDMHGEAVEMLRYWLNCPVGRRRSKTNGTKRKSR